MKENMGASNGKNTSFLKMIKITMVKELVFEILGNKNASAKIFKVLRKNSDRKQRES